jgi:hypothetical protein
MNNRLEKPHINIPCQAKKCKHNTQGYCQGLPDITVKEVEIVSTLDVYKPSKRETQEIWGCSNFEKETR